VTSLQKTSGSLKFAAPKWSPERGCPQSLGKNGEDCCLNAWRIASHPAPLGGECPIQKFFKFYFSLLAVPDFVW
jgi:hypothetical protein